MTFLRALRALRGSSSDRQELVVIEKHMNQVFAGALLRIGRWFD